MKIKWRLYIDVYDTLTRKELEPKDLTTGVINSQAELKGIFGQFGKYMPNDANYFTNSLITIRTKSLTLESPLCFSSKDETQKHSPCLVLEPDQDDPTVSDLNTIILELIK